MKLYKNQLFHIYNQGNNRRQLFYSDENYKFFLWKMRAYLSPFGDLIGYCLMPNHFHWLFYVKRIEIENSILKQSIEETKIKRGLTKYPNLIKTRKKIVKNDKIVTLNQCIGNLQKGYSKAINKQNNWTGSLFRGKCKAKDGWFDGLARETSNNDFRYNCLQYIHNNPVKAGLVMDESDWKYSSASDYLGNRNGTLCNIELGRKLLDFY